ncbi:MAG: hypothetical protein P8Y44_11805, partial [Acidobacteriota bacterium]
MNGDPHSRGRLLPRLEEAYRILGFRLLWTAPKHLVHPEYLVVAKDLSKIEEPESFLSSIGPLPGVRFSALGEEDLDKLYRADPRLPPSEARRRLRSGETCVLCWLSGNLAHYRWECENAPEIPLAGARLRLLAGDAFNSESYTVPEFRRRGLQHITAIAAYRRLRDRGFRRYLALVAPWNRVSLQATLKRGFQVVGAIGSWRLGKFRHCFARGRVRLVEHDIFVVDPG